MGWWRETIDIVKENDPAARTTLEVLLTYPGVKALAAHRLSHFLWKHGFKLLARMHSQFWRFWTQIEIHPGAQIDSGVFIDHGSGLVIGETAIVETGVLLYHGVTLGGTGKDCGKRHPTVRKGALISAHAQVIGPVEIGENAKVGAAAVVVADVPSDVTVVGIPAKIVRVHGKKDEPVIHIEFSDEELAELSQSIAENGLIQPIIVRKSDIIGYELIAGERRLRACKRLGMTEIPAVVKEVTDQESRKQAIIENLQRSNLNPIEEAKAYRSLINELAYSHEELAKAMGKSRPYISNALRLLQLPQEIQTSIENGKLSQGHARALLAVEDTKKQLTIYHQILTEKWSVRTLEKRLQELPKKQKSKKDIHIKDKEKELEKSLGLPVTLRYHKNHSGTIQIHFSTEEDFNRIINKLI